VLVGKHIESTGRSEPHGMILMGADEGVKRDEAITTRTILHHYRLAPARGQTLGTGCGIAGAASAKRQDEAHRPRRIGFPPNRVDIIRFSDWRKAATPEATPSPTERFSLETRSGTRLARRVAF